MIDPKYLQKFLDNAIAEDIGDGDHTSLACIPGTQTGTARIMAKQAGIIAGVAVADFAFRHFDPKLKVETHITDGSLVKAGDTIMRVSGRELSLLQMERLVLNIMQRMSGIATQTYQYAQRIAHTKAKVLDTRKTTPGLRLLEKEAVLLGGGANHRMGLYDMVMLKDNHIDFAGGIPEAVRRVQEYLQAKEKPLKVEVEARNFDEVDQILALQGIHRIMLDNFTPEDTRKAVEQIGNRLEIESSGMITLETITAYAEAGVDFISVGALTHQIRSLDISMKAG